MKVKPQKTRLWMFIQICIHVGLLSLPMKALAVGAPLEHETQVIIQTLNKMILSGHHSAQDLEPLRPESQYWENKLRSDFQELLAERIPGDSLDERTWIQKVTNALDWRKVTGFFSGVGKSIRKVGRINGQGAAYIFTLGVLLDFVYPPIFHKMGISYLIPVLAMTPYPVFMVSGANALQKYWYKQQLIRQIGGKQAYREYLAETKRFQVELKKHNKKRPLFPFFTPEGETVAFELSKGSLFEKAPWVQALKFTEIKKYCESKGILKDVIAAIENPNLQKLPEISKTVALIQAIQTDPELTGNDRFEFWNQFKDRTQKLPDSYRLPSQSGEILVWVSQMAKAKNLNAIQQGIRALPDTIAPHQALEIWNEILIPHWGGSEVELSLSEFSGLRKLSRNLEKEAILKHREWSLVDHKSWIQAWAQGIAMIEKKGGDCTIQFRSFESWGVE